jgi:hypothetical protein
MTQFTGKYWRDDPNAPFAQLLGAVETYCHPEAYDEAYDDLIGRARSPVGDEGIQRFKEQLIAALRDVYAVPEDALYEAAQYDDGADMAFLRRLWHDLYPDEPSPEHS